MRNPRLIFLEFTLVAYEVVQLGDAYVIVLFVDEPVAEIGEYALLSLW